MNDYTLQEKELIWQALEIIGYKFYNRNYHDSKPGATYVDGFRNWRSFTGYRYILNSALDDLFGTLLFYAKNQGYRIRIEYGETFRLECLDCNDQVCYVFADDDHGLMLCRTTIALIQPLILDVEGHQVQFVSARHSSNLRTEQIAVLTDAKELLRHSYRDTYRMIDLLNVQKYEDQRFKSFEDLDTFVAKSKIKASKPRPFALFKNIDFILR